MEQKEQKKGRLCSEIQLFDLCDKDVCSHKDGRYCTKGDILARFEAVLDEEDHSSEQFLADELDDLEGDDDPDYDDGYGADDYGEEESGDFEEAEDEQY